MKTWEDAVREGVHLALSRMTPEELYEMATDSYRQIREENQEH